MRAPFLAIVFLAALAACRSDVRVKSPDVGAAIPDLPLPPEGTFISRAGGADALQLTFHSATEEEGVIRYYRGILSEAPWNLVSDIQDSDGRTVLYAERDGPPLWVRIGRVTGGSGTTVELSGAVVRGDSSPAGAPAR